MISIVDSLQIVTSHGCYKAPTQYTPNIAISSYNDLVSFINKVFGLCKNHHFLKYEKKIMKMCVLPHNNAKASQL